MGQVPINGETVRVGTSLRLSDLLDLYIQTVREL